MNADHGLAACARFEPSRSASCAPAWAGCDTLLVLVFLAMPQETAVEPVWACGPGNAHYVPKSSGMPPRLGAAVPDSLGA